MPTWAIKSLLYLLATAAVAWALHAGYSSIWQRGYDAKTTEVNTQQMKDDRTAAIAALAREQEVRAIEVAQDAQLRQVAETFEQEKRHAELEASRVAADLRTGNLKLRQHWDACRATAALSGPAASLAQPDADADLRRTGAGDLVRVADQCTAHVSALQSAVRVMQGAGQ